MQPTVFVVSMLCPHFDAKACEHTKINMDGWDYIIFESEGLNPKPLGVQEQSFRMSHSY